MDANSQMRKVRIAAEKGYKMTSAVFTLGLLGSTCLIAAHIGLGVWWLADDFNRIKRCEK